MKTVVEVPNYVLEKVGDIQEKLRHYQGMTNSQGLTYHEDVVKSFLGFKYTVRVKRYKGNSHNRYNDFFNFKDGKVAQRTTYRLLRFINDAYHYNSKVFLELNDAEMSEYKKLVKFVEKWEVRDEV